MHVDDQITIFERSLWDHPKITQKNHRIRPPLTTHTQTLLMTLQYTTHMALDNF